MAKISTRDKLEKQVFSMTSFTKIIYWSNVGANIVSNVQLTSLKEVGIVS